MKKSISADGTPHFFLGENDRCPHLDECGLCNIITEMGEEYLCDICREHPRFYNFTNVSEVGIGMSCPEAARVILSSGDYTEFYEIGCVDAVGSVSFDGVGERGAVYEILSNESLEYSNRLREIYKKYSVPPREDAFYLEQLDSLEYLNGEHKAMFMNYSASRRSSENDIHYERFLGYLIYRHCTEAYDIEDFSARLGFCLFCERLLASLAFSCGAKSLEGISHLASIISEELEYSEENTFALTY